MENYRDFLNPEKGETLARLILLTWVYVIFHLLHTGPASFLLVSALGLVCRRFLWQSATRSRSWNWLNYGQSSRASRKAKKPRLPLAMATPETWIIVFGLGIEIRGVGLESRPVTSCRQSF
ncbi:hypothetical protein V6N12_016421 [Hibiscus sabdariffa]|uniref:Uncharacterized protein n=1 Tax=Hibiscus sabdariffa TaxID=183260 RepID=A0ABR2CDJ4_9ROSI